MLAALTCDSTYVFDSVCRAIDSHDPTGIAGPLVSRLTGSVGIFIVIYLAGRLVRRISDAAAHRGGADPQVRALLHNAIALFTYVAAVLSALVVAGANVSVLITAAGAGTVVIGLAFQDVLRNVLAGMWLLLERRFRLGDSIAVADVAGTVQNITLRTTTLRTGDGQLAVLPNLTVFTGTVINASTYDLRQFTVSVRVPAETDLESALRAARSVLESSEAIAKSPPPSLVPQLDAEWTLLHCRYWLDQRAQDPDAVGADVARRLWTVVSPGG
jgi:small-conductance mechanosensitive channel